MPAVEPTHTPTPEEIMEYLDGEGTDAARATIGAHLASCAACQAIAAEQRAISQDVHAWTVRPAPESLQPPAATRGRVLLRQVGAWRRSRVVLGAPDRRGRAPRRVLLQRAERTGGAGIADMSSTAAVDRRCRQGERAEAEWSEARVGGLPGSPAPPWRRPRSSPSERWPIRRSWRATRKAPGSRGCPR